MDWRRLDKEDGRGGIMCNVSIGAIALLVMVDVILFGVMIYVCKK